MQCGQSGGTKREKDKTECKGGTHCVGSVWTSRRVDIYFFFAMYYLGYCWIPVIKI